MGEANSWAMSAFRADSVDGGGPVEDDRPGVGGGDFFLDFCRGREERCVSVSVLRREGGRGRRRTEHSGHHRRRIECFLSLCSTASSSSTDRRRSSASLPGPTAPSAADVPSSSTSESDASDSWSSDSWNETWRVGLSRPPARPAPASLGACMIEWRPATAESNDADDADDAEFCRSGGLAAGELVRRRGTPSWPGDGDRRDDVDDGRLAARSRMTDAGSNGWFCTLRLTIKDQGDIVTAADCERGEGCAREGQSRLRVVKGAKGSEVMMYDKRAAYADGPDDLHRYVDAADVLALERLLEVPAQVLGQGSVRRRRRVIVLVNRGCGWVRAWRRARRRAEGRNGMAGRHAGG